MIKGAGMRIEEKIQMRGYLKRIFMFVSAIAIVSARCFAFDGGSWSAVESDSSLKLFQIAAGNENTVVGRDKNGDTYQLIDGVWKPLGGGKSRWIAAGSDGSIFAVGKDTRKLYRRKADAWEEVSGIDKLSRVIVLDQDHMWGTLSTKQGVDVWQFENGTWARPLSADGKTPASNWKNIAVAPGVFLVTDMKGNLMMRSSKIAPAKVAPEKKAAKKAAKKAEKKKKGAKKKKKSAKKKSASEKAVTKKKSAKKKGAKKKAASKKKAGKKKSAKKKSAKKKSAVKKKSSKKKSAKKKKKSAKKKSASKKSGARKKKSSKKKKASKKSASLE